MNKRIFFTLLILSVFAFASCKTAPEPVEEEPAAEEISEGAPEEVVEEAIVEEGAGMETPAEPVVEAAPEPQPEPVSREELALARQSLQRAEEADASRFAPDLMNVAYDDLKKAANLAESDPDQARLLLAGVIEKGDRAFEIGKDGLIAEALASMEKLDAQLLEIEAEKFSPGPYGEVTGQFDHTRDLIEQGDLLEARKAYNLAYLKARNLHRILSENIRWIGILERDTENYLADAEEQEAYLWADEEFIEASDLLSRGLTSFRQYDIETSENLLKEAKFKARNAIYLARTRKKQSETDQMLLMIQQELEDASTLMIQTETGDILEAEPWSGSDYLDENPLLDVKGEDYEAEDSELTEYDLNQPLKEEEPDEEIQEEEEEEIVEVTPVSTGMSESVGSLLDQAKELWKQGVSARNDGDYARSKELFIQAEAYIRAYRANAVEKTYTVQYRPVKTDCLWRIAGYDDIYGDPFLWPKIWKRNQKMIPNPDLIYPGQVLIIPPVEE